jgi:hypothetical protein
MGGGGALFPPFSGAIMYDIVCYLNQVPDAHIQMRVDDTPALRAVLYDADGTAFSAPDWTYMACILIVRRSDENWTNEIYITAEVDADTTDNIWFFKLDQINYGPGNYEAHVCLQATYDDPATTPIGPVTPLDQEFSFEMFEIEVLA